MCGDVMNGIDYKVAERLGADLRQSSRGVQISYHCVRDYEMMLYTSKTSPTIEVEFGLGYDDVVSDEDFGIKKKILKALEEIRKLSNDVFYPDDYGYLPQKPNIWMGECVSKENPERAASIIVENALLFANICNKLYDAINNKAA